MTENRIIKEMTIDALHDIEIARNMIYTIYGYTKMNGTFQRIKNNRMYLWIFAGGIA